MTEINPDQVPGLTGWLRICAVVAFLVALGCGVVAFFSMGGGPITYTVAFAGAAFVVLTWALLLLAAGEALRLLHRIAYR